MLYIISTPIGNLKDLSQRAVETLSEADAIACEDTRTSLKLLQYYNIKKPLFSYHKFNEKEKCGEIIEMLQSGKDIALISDAGTPIISDPGSVLISKLIELNISYTHIPGACAAISALVLSGFSALKFVFAGFLPERGRDRKSELGRLKAYRETLVFYCAPHDLLKTVTDIYDVFGERRACAVREITKIHEEVEHFMLSEGYGKEPRGEYVLIVEGNSGENVWLQFGEAEHIRYYLDQGMSKKDALKKVASERGISKSELYKRNLDIE